MDWKTGSYLDSTTTVWTNPNGNPKDNQGYYTQDRKFYNDYMDHANDMWDKFYAMDPIQQDAEKWSNWEEMHENVWWFDTAGCWSGNFIGAVNSVVIAPDASTNAQLAFDPTKTYNTQTATDASPALNAPSDSGSAFGTNWGGWYIGAQYSTASPSKDYNNDKAYNKLVAPKDASGPYQRNWEN